jgi:hypothetical protein
LPAAFTDVFSFDRVSICTKRYSWINFYLACRLWFLRISANNLGKYFSQVIKFPKSCKKCNGS